MRVHLCIIAALFALGCQKQIPGQKLWGGDVTIAQGKHLHFFMQLDLNAVPPHGYFINGDEQSPIPEIAVAHDSLSLFFSEYGAAMLGAWNGSTWSGKLYRYRKDTTMNEFTASPVDVRQPSAVNPAHSISLSGKFLAYFTAGRETDSSTSANFWQKNDSIEGTFIAPDGDYGLLTGTQTGNIVTLQRFTGWQAFLFEARQEGSGWKGKLYSRSGEPQIVDLIPASSQPKKPQTEVLPGMRDPHAHFFFSGTTPDGDHVTANDARFLGKALIVDIMGTWCHNCMDAAPLLQKLYTDFHSKGLEIVGLSFEISDDSLLAKKNLSLFQHRYGITYPVLFCGSTNDANVEKRLRSQLRDFSAYPTTIFIDKKNHVCLIHCGFRGPGTGEEYQQQIRDYENTVKRLLQPS